MAAVPRLGVLRGKREEQSPVCAFLRGDGAEQDEGTRSAKEDKGSGEGGKDLGHLEVRQWRCLFAGLPQYHPGGGFHAGRSDDRSAGSEESYELEVGRILRNRPGVAAEEEKAVGDLFTVQGFADVPVGGRESNIASRFIRNGAIDLRKGGKLIKTNALVFRIS